ncbi:MAG: ubiquinol-cytochrome c reductase iron-sulfur subunit N-terminal domain-containing protein [Candidatus Geothermarchaeales archaeon]
MDKISRRRFLKIAAAAAAAVATPTAAWGFIEEHEIKQFTGELQARIWKNISNDLYISRQQLRYDPANRYPRPNYAYANIEDAIKNYNRQPVEIPGFEEKLYEVLGRLPRINIEISYDRFEEEREILDDLYKSSVEVYKKYYEQIQNISRENPWIDEKRFWAVFKSSLAVMVGFPLSIVLGALYFSTEIE